MKIEVLGAAMEIGRSAIKLSTDNSKLLLDYGVLIHRDEPKFPLPVSSRDLNAILLTHAHLDHSGGIPLFYASSKPKLLTTKLTGEITNLLIKDLIKISSYYLPYEFLELNYMLKSIEPIEIGDELRIKDLNIYVLNAGHVPGSVMFLIRAYGKKILYTGDFNTIDTKMLHGAKINFPDIDVIIMEGTYATVDHEERSIVEANFINSIHEVINSNGTVVIPAFSVGRSQEILCVLYHHGIRDRIFIDGMAKTASTIFLDHPQYFRDYKLLSDALKKATWVDSWSKRRKICKESGVIIAPAGMLKGGIVRFYVKKIAKEERNAIFLVSYQVEDTPGAMLIKSGEYNFGKNVEKISAKVKYFDFSSHCGNKELVNVIKSINAKRVILVHGEKKKLEQFKEILEEEKLAEQVIIPEVGEEIPL
ncbi:MAG: MBL fold metallo-hydrolase [Candidatus Methanomethylicia archaeon]